MSDRMELAEWVLDAVGDRAEVEVRVTGGNLALTRFANSFIHQNVGEEGDSVTLRVASGGRVASGTTTNTGREALVRFIDDAIERASHQPVDEDWPGLASPSADVALDHYDPATAAASPAERAERVAAFVAAGTGMRAAGYCSTQSTEIAFANSNGVRREGRATEAILDGIHQTDTSAGSGHAASGRLGDIDAGAVGALAAQRAADGADVSDVKPGEYEVVLAPECVASICVFLSYYGFNGKGFNEGQSFVELGAQQFDEQLTLVDDVTDPRAMAIGFDYDGTARGRLDLVAEGVTRTVAHDRRSARKAGAVSTGHALPGSEVYGAFPTTVFMNEGDSSVEELIAGVDRGLYVATFNYCRVLEPKTMAVTGLTRNGTFMIENGRITGAVTGLRFTQSFVAGLGPGRILGIGNDGRWADSEFGAGLMHVPSLRLAGWHFTGGAEG